MTSSATLATRFFELGPVKKLERWLNAMPHPSLVVEIASTHVAAAHWSKTGGHLESHAIEPLPLGAIMASPVDANVVQPEAVRSALRKVFNRVPVRDAPLALLIPDPVVRVFILPFDTLPRRADEAVPLLRWRLNRFPILDDNKPPQSILNFRRETDLPLHLGLLIDVSGSVHGRFDFEQDAATSFLQHSIRAGFDKAFIVGFNTQSQMSQDFTDNVQLLSAGVHKLAGWRRHRALRRHLPRLQRKVPQGPSRSSCPQSHRDCERRRR